MLKLSRRGVIPGRPTGSRKARPRSAKPHSRGKDTSSAFRLRAKRARREDDRHVKPVRPRPSKKARAGGEQTHGVGGSRKRAKSEKGEPPMKALVWHGKEDIRCD